MSEKKEYIERGALSKFVRDVRKRLPKDSKDFFTRDEMLLNFQQYVDAQAAADVEPVVRGEWKERRFEGDFAIYSECSKCGYTHKMGQATFSKIKEVRYGEHKFCPNCGANMMERSGSGESTC